MYVCVCVCVCMWSCVVRCLPMRCRPVLHGVCVYVYVYVYVVLLRGVVRCAAALVAFRALAQSLDLLGVLRTN